MKIQEITFNEINKLSELQPEGWPDIIPKFEFYTKSDFCFPIKFIIDESIVGIGCAIIHENCSWLAHIIVHPKRRNQGIGKTITQKLINLSNEKNCTTILLIATELGAYVYEKLGFEIETEYIFHKVSKNEIKHIPSEYITPYQESFKNIILEFDKNISGENRSINLLKHLEKSMIYLVNGKIEGYFMPTLGEGHILAISEKAGIELIKLRLNTHENIIFPVNNLIAKNYTTENNYKIVYEAKRMRKGEIINVELSNIYSRIGGNLG